MFNLTRGPHRTKQQLGTGLAKRGDRSIRGWGGKAPTQKRTVTVHSGIGDRHGEGGPLTQPQVVLEVSACGCGRQVPGCRMLAPGMPVLQTQRSQRRQIRMPAPEAHERRGFPAPSAQASSRARPLPEPLPPPPHVCNRWGPGLGVFPVPRAAHRADGRQHELARDSAGDSLVGWSCCAAQHAGRARADPLRDGPAANCHYPLCQRLLGRQLLTTQASEQEGGLSRGS